MRGCIRSVELRRLRLLAELQRRGTVAAVAEALAYSPSSVSVQLAELQREAGVPLLERVGRTLELTEAGVRLAEYANQALAAEEAVRVDLASIDTEPQGRVRVSFFQTAGITLVPQALRLLASTAPRLRVELVHQETAPACEELRARLLDVVIGTDYDPIPAPVFRDLDRVDLIQEDMVLAVPRDRTVAERRDVVLADLERDAWAAGTPGTGHAACIEHLCRGAGGYEPDVRHRSDDALVLRALVTSGQAVTLLPALLGVANDAVAVRTVPDATIRRTVFTAVRATTKTTAAVRAVRSALHDCAVEIASGRTDVRTVTAPLQRLATPVPATPTRPAHEPD